MSIKSTQDITREEAFARIEEVLHNLKKSKFKALRKNSNEHDYEMDNEWDANEIIGRVMDLPFFRKSIFENYNVVNEINTSEE